MKEFTYGELQNMARKHLEFTINAKDKTEMMFRLAGFYGTFVTVLKEKYGKDCPMKGRMCQCSSKEKCIHV